MNKLSDKLVEIRMGDPLEKRLKENRRFMQRQKELADILRENWEIPQTKKQRVKKSDKIWDSIGRYNYSYGETAYRLGYEDGVWVGMEQKVSGKRSLLSLEDMTDLVRMYDAVKQLNTTLYGSNEYHEKDEGVLGALERVYYVIHNGIGYKLEFLGEDESDESITYILDGVDGSPEKRAKMLLGEIPVDAE